MYKVFLQVPILPDAYLGNVREDGSVYRSKPGLDKQVGRVDTSNGKIYEDRFGPDKKVGHVHLKTGKVYSTRLGPDKYVGRVDDKGHMHRHVAMGSDEYIGKVDRFVSYAHAAGAMILLVLPFLETEESSISASKTDTPETESPSDPVVEDLTGEREE